MRSIMALTRKNGNGVKEKTNMPITPSPLRYPGGKTKLYDYVKRILDTNSLHGTYIEPFAGGAGLALKLLLNGDVKKIVINDSDPAIYSFWDCVINHTDELCDYVESVTIDMQEWHKSREVYFHPEKYSSIDLGKATLFLNRVNRSGVLQGGVIGGKKQSGEYKMDARFNRDELVSKINTISSRKDSIDIYNMDALEFLAPSVLRHYYKVFINLDPPYVEKGGQLYLNYYREEDHKRLHDALIKLSRKWIVTYDYCEYIEELYKDFRGSCINVQYSANKSRKAKELIYFSNSLIIPE